MGVSERIKTIIILSTRHEFLFTYLLCIFSIYIRYFIRNRLLSLQYDTSSNIDHTWTRIFFYSIPTLVYLIRFIYLLSTTLSNNLKDRQAFVYSQEQIPSFHKNKSPLFTSIKVLLSQEQMYSFHKNKYPPFTRTNTLLSQEQKFSFHKNKCPPFIRTKVLFS